MKTTGFTHDITIYVKFTKEEFDTLIKAFNDPMNESYKNKYLDPGVGAFMNANRNYFGDNGELRFTDHQINICSKVLELAGMGSSNKSSDEFFVLYGKMYNLHKEIVKENERIKSDSENSQMI